MEQVGGMLLKWALPSAIFSFNGATIPFGSSSDGIFISDFTFPFPAFIISRVFIQCARHMLHL